MKIIRNVGQERVVDLARPSLAGARALDLVSSALSLYAFAELSADLAELRRCRLLLPPEMASLSLLGTEADRSVRNRLQGHWHASQLRQWLEEKAEIRCAPGGVPQGALVVRDSSEQPLLALMGSLSFSTDGLGLTPGNPMNLVQASETPQEAALFGQWFEAQWSTLRNGGSAKQALIEAVERLAADRAPHQLYALILHHLFQDREDVMDEERIVRSATGIRDTVVWEKLYSFQRDGVIAAIDKLERYGGCIIADSVGLGKTFEALAVIKYHELRNDRVLVLCPKRLRDNWTLYAANDRRNVLAQDRFNYDVLNHTDLSRDSGYSGDLDLSHINWGNYDLVVIDESHNFRNKKTPKKGSETRYDRLMRQIVREGVKTRVLMLSATPVNNRLADLRNQIAFATEGDDTALADEGIESIDSTTRAAQKAFNRWRDLPQAARTTERLVEMLGFDYFSLLDKLTIARSRKHVEKYYGTDETGRFPERLPPINVKADVDLAGGFPPIGTVNNEIRRLRLAAYAPLRYVLPQKQAAYERKYSTEIRGGESVFRQADREESLIHLMRVNLLKRMESSVASFRLTLERQLGRVENLLSRMEDADAEVDEPDVEEVDFDDPTLEPLLVGRSVQVLLTDVDRVRWRQDLEEDRDRLLFLLRAVRAVTATRDAKLAALRERIEEKVRRPINGENRKMLVFTAFADTAEYLYEHLVPWAEKLGIESALVTGSGGNQTTLGGLKKDMGSILAAFAPLAKERPADLADEGEVDLLIATDCISEGQNLQDCDYLINYDIHWNPVRIIQRFGRIDRIGSPNERIQLVNFWPNVELDTYIDLEGRVSGRMVLLDVSATGEENVIERQSGDPMNDLDYRREQLKRMQDAVLDLEDLNTGVSITDLTLTDFRIDLARYHAAHPGVLGEAPLGAFSIVTAEQSDEVPPGVVFCLRAEGEAAKRAAPPGYPLAPYFLVHVGEDGAVLLPFTQAKRVLDRMKRLCLGQDAPDPEACDRFHTATEYGADMRAVQRQLSAAVASVVGKSEERAVASLFSTGGTHALAGEFAGADDFEVVAFFVILSAEAA
jgi:hypothetical protein